MREVDLELDYCPKCEPEETQDPFPTQSFKFFYMFSVAVKCVNCGTYYVPSPRLGVIVTIVYFLGVWIDEYLAEITADSFSSIMSLVLLLAMYGLSGVLLHRFGTWRPISGNKPLEQQEYLLPILYHPLISALYLLHYLILNLILELITDLCEKSIL